MKTKHYLLQSLEETEDFAKTLARTLVQPQVIALFGDLGAGKTTFVRAFVTALQNGDKARVKSPSYSLHHAYNTTPKAHHLDLYRLTSVEDLEDLGLLEIIHEEAGFVLIEWPALILDRLPQKTIHIFFEEIEDGIRKVEVRSI